MNQLDMPLSREPSHAAIAVELVRAQKTSAAAFTLACSVSGLDDKEIYLSLDIDAGYFSNIKKGKATLQADKAAEFCRVVGNTVYMEWLAYQLGCTLVMIKSEAERRIHDVQMLLAKPRFRDEPLALVPVASAAASTIFSRHSAATPSSSAGMSR